MAVWDEKLPNGQTTDQAMAAQKGGGIGQIGDMIGNLLGIPGQVLGEAGNALAYSVRPDGKISLLRLMDVGGIRTAETKAREMATRAAEADLKAKEIANQYEPQRQQAAHIKDIAAIQGMDADTRAAITQALYGAPTSPAGGPTTESDIARQSQAAAWGLTDQSNQQAAADQAQAEQQAAAALGVKPEQAGAMLHTLGGEKASAAGIAALAETQRQKNRQANIALRASEARQTAKEKIVNEPLKLESLLTQTRAAVPPWSVSSTVKQPNPALSGLPAAVRAKMIANGEPEFIEKTVHQFRPRTQKDWNDAIDQTTATIDKLREYQRQALGMKPKSISVEEAQITKNVKKRATQLVQSGVAPEQASFVASLEATGVENVIQTIPPASQLPPGALAPQIGEVLTALDGAAKIGSPALAGKNIGAILIKKLVDAGYTESDARVILRQASEYARAKRQKQ